MNKYHRWYTELVTSRQLMGRKFTKYCGMEKHHILPKSLGGGNTKANLVVLTPREHCIAHMLLVRMYSGTSKAKMIYALQSLMNMRNKHREVISSRLYESLRRDWYNHMKDPDYIAMRSELTKKQWTPERKAAVAEKARRQWIDDPRKREFFESDEWKQRQRVNTSRRWESEEYQQFQSDKAKAQWKEGGSLHSRKTS